MDALEGGSSEFFFTCEHYLLVWSNPTRTINRLIKF
jgi:hypothetical protein